MPEVGDIAVSTSCSAFSFRDDGIFGRRDLIVAPSCRSTSLFSRSTFLDIVTRGLSPEYISRL